MPREPLQVDDVWKKIKNWLEEMPLSSNASINDENRAAKLMHGTIKVDIRVIDEPPHGPLIRFIVVVAKDIKKLTSSILAKLLELNSTVYFGKFCLDVEKNDITFEHSLLGGFIDKDEFTSALGVVAEVADKYDEEICYHTKSKRGID